ncbi:MAG: hypothetical protein WBV82_20065 [Myxococcaceae bacterium]
MNDINLPIVESDAAGWRVRMVSGKYRQTYFCESEEQARRFAALFARPVREKKVREKKKKTVRAWILRT